MYCFYGYYLINCCQNTFQLASMQTKIVEQLINCLFIRKFFLINFKDLSYLKRSVLVMKL